VFGIGKTIDSNYIGHYGRGGEDAHALHACEDVDLLHERGSGKEYLIDKLIGFMFKVFE